MMLDPDPRESILTQYERLVQHYALRFDATGKHTEDLAQSGRIGLLRGIETYGTESMAYVHGSITSGMIDYIRHETHRGKGLQYAPLVEWQGAEPDTTCNLLDRIEAERLLSVLKPRARKVMRDYFYMGMSQNEIAQTMGVCESRVQQIVRGAIKRIRGGL
jgi:RNA polymerase sporulation-specific sigma factor